MCVYCVIGDHTFRYDPPFEVDPRRWPSVPQPVTPVVSPWEIERLKEYLDLLKQAKELEDKLGCPCVPNKADYIGLIENRIKKLKKKAKRK